MKRIKLFTIIYISLACFFLFPITGKADSKKNGTDACVSNGTCLQVCEWNHNEYHAYVYYLLEEDKWKYVWYYKNSNKTEQKSESSNSLPTKEIFYENDTIKTDLVTKGVCPAGAYMNPKVFGASKALCLDTGKVVETNKNGTTRTYCTKGSNGVRDSFQGSSKLIFDINVHIQRHFEETAFPELEAMTCDSFADSTGYAVDDSKVQPIIDNFSMLFTELLLYGRKMPTWMQNGTYATYMKRYREKIDLKVAACNVVLKEKAEEDLKDGIITQDEFDQAIENGKDAEQNVQDRFDQYEQDVANGNLTYTPDLPVQDVTNGDCDSLLGSKTKEYLNTALTIIQIAGVVLAILLGMGDFIGAILSGENDSNKKAFKKFIIRISMAAILFLVPAILKFVLDTFGIGDGSICIL